MDPSKRASIQEHSRSVGDQEYVLDSGSHGGSEHERNAHSHGHEMPKIYHIEDEYTENLEAFVADAPSKMVRRQREQATMFGMPKWKPQIRRKDVNERSSGVREILEGEDTLPKADIIAEVAESETIEAIGISSYFVTRGNVMYSVCFGWLLFLVYMVAAALMAITVIGLPYAKYCYSMAFYHFWPFGKYVCKKPGLERLQFAEEETELLRKSISRPDIQETSPDSSIAAKAAYCIWCVVCSLVVVPFHLFVFAFCWFFVLTIPMAKMNFLSVKWNYHSQNIDVLSGYPGAGRDVLICTYKAANLYYYKYTVGGMNIILVNLLPFVFFSLFIGYLMPPLSAALGTKVVCPPTIRLILALFSIIPLTYYISTAVSSLSAQTSSFAAGAVLNATFGSICELIVYCSAIIQHLDDLVQAGVTGSLLGVMLLLPGISMLLGGMKFKEQRFSRSAAGVSSVLLLLSIVGTFLPTIFYQIYGATSLYCGGCMGDRDSNGFHVTNGTVFGHCDYCYTNEVDLRYDPVYKQALNLSYASAALMPIAYCVGLLFTLKTHTHIYDMEEDEEDKGGHDAPEWSRWQCIVILVVCTALFAALAEELLSALQPTLDAYDIPESFAGLTIIAVVPNTAEIVNAVQFSLQGNFALSLEIGSSAAVQIALIQIPVLLIFSVLINGGNPDCGSFTLVFPTIDFLAVVVSTLVLTFVALEGKSNYFTGVVLLIVYALFVTSFWFVGQITLDTPAMQLSLFEAEQQSKELICN